jgi:hypothetical protein
MIFFQTTYALYYLDTNDLDSAVTTGDSLSVQRGVLGGSSSTDDTNEIDPSVPLLIIDVHYGTPATNAYVIVENTAAVDETLETGELIATITNKEIAPYTMFSRCTFSTIRKTNDRELVFLWKIYF